MKKTATKERPILFSGEMVRAILDGRKTQTRRVIKLPEDFDINEYPRGGCGLDSVGMNADSMLDLQVQMDVDGCDVFLFPCPYGQPGDELWVRETWRPSAVMEGQVRYAATCGESHHRWRPSIHMPRWASRIQLRITDVRVERVQDISEKDAIAEGIELCGNELPFSGFVSLWDSINASRGFGWDVNPWVWVVEFERIERNVGEYFR